jgi:hypothetical protein
LEEEKLDDDSSEYDIDLPTVEDRSSPEESITYQI